MTSLSDIPEPTTAFSAESSDDLGVEVGHAVPLGLYSKSDEARVTQEVPDDPEHQIDSATFLMLLLIGGGLLRMVLMLLGPIQVGGIDAGIQRITTDFASLASDRGASAEAFVLYGLLADVLVDLGSPSWVLLAIGVGLSLLAIPAAYAVGRSLTGRRAPGILAATLVAFHPAVLTSAIRIGPEAIALGLGTVGLAMVCLSASRRTRDAAAGALLIALAGLTAPMCWLLGVVAGAVILKRYREADRREAWWVCAMTVCLSIGPVAGYRAYAFADHPEGLLVEWSGDVPGRASDAAELPVVNRWLITMTYTSIDRLGQALDLPLTEAGHFSFDQPEATGGERDPVADALADGWLLINAALGCMAALSLGVMVCRRRVVESVALMLVLGGFAFSTLPPGELLRLPMIALVGVAALGLVASRPVISDRVLQARFERRASRLAEKEERQRATAERRSQKQLAKLYAFDEADAASEKRSPGLLRAIGSDAKNRTSAPSVGSGVLTQRVADEPTIPSRPI